MRTSAGEPVLHVIDANCSWIRSLAESSPPGWRIRSYRMYSPHWLPNGRNDFLRFFRSRQTMEKLREDFPA